MTEIKLRGLKLRDTCKEIHAVEKANDFHKTERGHDPKYTGPDGDVYGLKDITVDVQDGIPDVAEYTATVFSLPEDSANYPLPASDDHKTKETSDDKYVLFQALAGLYD